MVRSFCAFFLCLFAFLDPVYGKGLDQVNNDQDKSPIIIDAQESIVCDEIAQKCVATGLGKAQKGTSIVYGDVLTVDFTKDRDITSVAAEGNVRMETPTETAYGEHAHYDVALDRVLMTGGNLKLVSPKQIVTATESIEYWHGKQQGIARGNALVDIPEKNERIQADTLVAYFCSHQNEAGKTEIEKVEATGNVLTSSPSGIVTGDRGVYYAKLNRVEIFGNALVEIPEKKELVQADKIVAYFFPAKENNKKTEIEKIEATGNVLASSPTGIVTGDRGIYYAKTEMVEMFGNVEITQGENIIKGQYGRANLKTNLMEVFPDIPGGDPCLSRKRISGVIVPRSAKKIKKPCP